MCPSDPRHSTDPHSPDPIGPDHQITATSSSPLPAEPAEPYDADLSEEQDGGHAGVDLLPPLQNLNENSAENPPHADEEEETSPAVQKEAVPLKGRAKQRFKKTNQDEARARSRQLSYLQQRREQKRFRVFVNRFHIVMRLVFSIACVTVLIYTFNAPFWTYTDTRVSGAHIGNDALSPITDIENYMEKWLGLQLIGMEALPPVDFRDYSRNHLLQSEDITPYLNRYRGWNLLKINPAEIEAALKSHYPIIDSIFIRRALFPSRLSVTLTEKPPVAVLYADTSNPMPYAIVDQQHNILALAPYRHTKWLDYLSQMRLQKLIIPPQTVINRQTLIHADQLAAALQSIPIARLLSLDLTNPNLLVAHYDGLDVVVGRPDRTVESRISRLYGLAPQLRNLQGWVDKVDIRWERQTTLHKSPLWLKASTVKQPVPVPADILLHFDNKPDEPASPRKSHE